MGKALVPAKAAQGLAAVGTVIYEKVFEPLLFISWAGFIKLFAFLCLAGVVDATYLITAYAAFLKFCFALCGAIPAIHLLFKAGSALHKNPTPPRALL